MPNPLPKNELPPVPLHCELNDARPVFRNGLWTFEYPDGDESPTAAEMRLEADWLDRANGVTSLPIDEHEWPWLAVIRAIGLDAERSYSLDEILAHIAQLQDAAKIGRAAVSNAMEDDAFGLLRDIIGAARCVGSGALARVAARVRRGFCGK